MSQTPGGRLSQLCPTLRAGIPALAAGDTLWLQAGAYADTAQSTLAVEHSGSADKETCLFAALGAKPVLDFSGQPYGKDSNPRGLELDGSYWHLRGLEVEGSADNGIYVSGKHNVVENCVTHGNRDTGLQIGRRANADQPDWPSDNLILNCESYDNYDMPPGAGENHRNRFRFRGPPGLHEDRPQRRHGRARPLRLPLGPRQQAT